MPRVLRVFPILLMTGAFAAMVLRATASLTNPDTFFHLRIGAHFLHGWSPWSPGHLNKFATGNWAPTQWLSQVVMAWVAERFGLAGVSWLSGLWFVTLAGVLYAVCRRRAPSLVAAVVSVLALFASLNGLSARPQVLSYILTAVTVDAWLRTSCDRRPRWWLIPLGWLWAMVHGMFVVGVVTSVVAAVALALDQTDRRRFRLLLIPLGMSVAAALTPAGPALYRSVLLVGSRSSIFNEWKPPNYTSPTTAALGGMLALTIILALRRERTPWIIAALLTLACAWGVYATRTVPVAAVIVAPLLAAELGRTVTDRGTLRGERWWLLGLASAALCALVFTAPQGGRIHQPAWVGPALKRMPQGTAVLANWEPAGYLTWAYPQVAPVMTGYADMYTDAELRRFVNLMALSPGWERTVASYQVDVALLDPTLPLAYALRTELHWQVRHRSKDVEMLVAPAEPQAAAR